MAAATAQNPIQHVMRVAKVKAEARGALERARSRAFLAAWGRRPHPFGGAEEKLDCCPEGVWYMP